jgi:palmitoyltransferase ZDHHC9/14/18
MVDKKGHPIYNHSLHRGRNRFFCGGYLPTGGDSPWAFISSLVVVFGITGVYFGTTCVWWWKNESPAVAAIGAYMTLLTISSMLRTVSTAVIPSALLLI